MKYLMLILLFGACTSQKNTKREENYVYLNRAYHTKLTKNEIIKTLGEPSEVLESGIIYHMQNTKFPKLGVFFDKNNHVETAFYIADENELSEVKKKIICDWDEQDMSLKRSHYVINAKKGQCKQLEITYQIMKNSRSYEIRWEHNENSKL